MSGLPRLAGLAAAAALVASLAPAAVAYARFSATAQNPGNSISAATLAAAGTPGSVHPNVSGSGTGAVTLTWSTSATSWTQSYLVSRAPATTGTPAWASLGSVPASACATTCTYTDSTGGYGQQYLYQVQSVYNSWTSAGGLDLALSLQPARSTPAGASTDTTKYAITEQPALPGAGSQPGQIAGGGGGDNHVYFAELGGGRLGRLDVSTGGLVELALGTGWTAWGVTVDGADANNVYFTENAATASRVGRLVLTKLNACPVTGGQIAYATLLSCGGLVEWTVNATASVGLRGIAGDATSVYFAENAANQVGAIKISNGSVTAEVSAGTAPVSVAVPSFDTSNVYFTESGSNKIGKAHANSSLNGRADSAAIAGATPWGIAGGSDSNLWFTESGTNRVAAMSTALALVSEYAVPSTGASPTSIALGADNNLWLTESGASRVASVTTGGTFTEYGTPTASSAPSGLAKGPDGHVWLTESAAAANRVATVTSSLSYALDGGDVANLGTADGVRYQTQAWAATASTGTYTQAVTFVPAAPVIPAGGAAVSTVRVVLNYQMPAIVAGQSNPSAGLRIGVSPDGGQSYTYYPLPNPQQASPACPSPGGGATESCSFTSPNMQVVLGVPSTVVGTTAQLSRLLVQVQAAPGSGSAFALAFDLAHVDVN